MKKLLVVVVGVFFAVLVMFLWSGRVDTVSSNRELITKCSFNIKGMHCSSCAAMVKKTLDEIQGVEEAEASFASKKGIVSFNSNKTKFDDIRIAIASLGYKTYDQKCDHQQLLNISK